MMSNPAKNRWLQYWQQSPRARIRLFCFPYAGGSASLFRTWHLHFPQEVEVCPVQLPGREGRLSDPPFSDLHLLIDELVPALAPFLDRPYAFFGHSMGALISFEIARYLQRVRSHPLPVHLFVSGRRAPQIPDLDPPTSLLPEAEFIEELRRLNGTPEEVLQNKELLNVLMPILRADFRICETYTYVDDEPLRCPITAFGGLYDAEVSPTMIAAWKEQTRLAFKQRFFAGDHFFLHKEQKALLTVITQDMLTVLQR